MTNTRRTRARVAQILIPVGIVLSAIAGCLFVAYGLNFFAPPEAAPGTIQVDSSPNVIRARAGDVVTYVVTLSNQGRGPVEIRSVSDTLLGDLSASFAPRLAAGSRERRVFTRTVRPDDPDPLQSTVTVSGASAGETLEAASTAELDILKPAVGVRVALTPTAARPGDQVQYSVTLSNPGDVDLRKVAVTDSVQGDLSPSFPPVLAPGESHGQTYLWTIPGDAPGLLTRTVTVRADSAGRVVSDTAAVVLDLSRPAVRVETAVEPAATVPGETVTYTIAVANVGTMALESITVTDSLDGDLSASFSSSLAAQATEQRAFPWVVARNDSLPLTRTVTVRAQGAGELVTDDASTVVAQLQPVLRVESSVSPPTTVRGETATYTVTLVNAGQIDLRGLRVEDSVLGNVSRAFPRVLSAGTSHSQAYTWSGEADAAGSLARSVTASAQGAGQVVSDTTTTTLNLASVSTSAQAPRLARPGDEVVVTVTVTNTSSAGAPDLVLERVLHGGRELTLPDACQTLSTAEKCTFNDQVLVPTEGDELVASLEVRYRVQDLQAVVSDVAQATVAVLPPWQRGSGLPDGLQVRTLAVCSADPQVLYAGFGDGASGVYRSQDGGRRWTTTALGQDARVFGLAIDPADCRTVYAGAWDGGVRTSQNGGRSWEPTTAGLDGAFVYSVVVDPTDADVLYAGTAERGVYRSDDGGSTWRPWGLHPFTVPDVRVAPDGRVVYAATWSEGVYRRGRSGVGWGAWAPVNDGIPGVHQDVYAVAVHPQDGTTVFAATSAGGVYRTRDGGATWEQVLPAPRTAYAVAVRPGVVHAATAAGVYRSTARGEPGSWETFNEGLEDLTIRAIAVGDATVHVGSGDGVWHRPR